MQNGREDNLKENIRPTHITPQGLRWEHSRPLIFEAGNEYHKFEVLDVSHATMGLERIVWDGERYQAFPFANTPAATTSTTRMPTAPSTSATATT